MAMADVSNCGGRALNSLMICSITEPRLECGVNYKSITVGFVM